jgi:hypothetical protein
VNESTQTENKVSWKEMRATKLLGLMSQVGGVNLAGDHYGFAMMSGSDVSDPWRDSSKRSFYGSQIKN